MAYQEEIESMADRERQFEEEQNQQEMNRQILAAFAEPADDPDYQAFVASMVPFCRCEYDCPCDSVLAAGPCEMKEEQQDWDYEE